MGPLLVPTEVTVEIPPAFDPTRPEDQLCRDELICLLEELGDLGVPSVRLEVEHLAFDSPVYDLLEYGALRRMRVTLRIPPRLAIDHTTWEALRATHLRTLELEIQSSDPRSHDAMTGLSGSWIAQARNLETARRAGVDVRVRTSITSAVGRDVLPLLRLLTASEVTIWSVEWDARLPQGLRAAAPQIEMLLATLSHAAIPPSAPTILFREIPQLHRYLEQRFAIEPETPRARGDAPVLLRHVSSIDARTTLFVTRRGQVFPSRHLRLAVGHVREQMIGSIFTYAPLCRQMRDVRSLKGHCGVCEFRTRCGGSRARAWASTGDPFAEDPDCMWRSHESPPHTPAAA